MSVLARVLLPEPFGPMTACTSPAGISSESPLTIGLPSTDTCRSSILSTAPFAVILAPVANLRVSSVSRAGLLPAASLDCLGPLLSVFLQSNRLRPYDVLADRRAVDDAAPPGGLRA